MDNKGYQEQQPPPYNYDQQPYPNQTPYPNQYPNQPQYPSQSYQTHVVNNNTTSTYTATSPLLPTNNVVVVEQKKKKMSWIGFCCICICLIVIFGSIFGSWAAKCSNYNYSLTLNHNTNLLLTPKIHIETYGSLSLDPQLGLFGIKSTEVVHAPDHTTALYVPMYYRGSNSEFTLLYGYDFWNCYYCDVQASLDMTQISVSTLILKSHNHGDISVGDFGLAVFNDATIKANSGKISIGRLYVPSGNIEVSTNNGPIMINELNFKSLYIRGSDSFFQFSTLTGPYVDVRTSRANIEFTTINAGDVRLQTFDGLISGAISLGTSNPSLCKLNVKSSNGAITLNKVDFVNLGIGCSVNVDSTNAFVSVTVSGFTGSFSLRTSVGTATATGFGCTGSSCSGQVGGSNLHRIDITSSNANVELIIQ